MLFSANTHEQLRLELRHYPRRLSGEKECSPEEKYGFNLFMYRYLVMLEVLPVKFVWLAIWKTSHFSISWAGDSVLMVHPHLYFHLVSLLANEEVLPSLYISFWLSCYSVSVLHGSCAALLFHAHSCLFSHLNLQEKHRVIQVSSKNGARSACSWKDKRIRGENYMVNHACFKRDLTQLWPVFCF